MTADDDVLQSKCADEVLDHLRLMRIVIIKVHRLCRQAITRHVDRNDVIVSGEQGGKEAETLQGIAEAMEKHGNRLVWPGFTPGVVAEFEAIYADELVVGIGQRASRHLGDAGWPVRIDHQRQPSSEQQAGQAKKNALQPDHVCLPLCPGTSIATRLPRAFRAR